MNNAQSSHDNDRRREMMKKAHMDAKKETDAENEAAYQKRSTQLDNKDKQKTEVVEDDWLGGMKKHNVDDD